MIDILKYAKNLEKIKVLGSSIFFLSTLGPNPAQTRALPERPARLTTLMCSAAVEGRLGKVGVSSYYGGIGSRL